MKHIISPNYSSYDLKLKFEKERMEVRIEGYIWPKEFLQLNQFKAENPGTRLLPDILDLVLQQEAALPTTTL